MKSNKLLQVLPLYFVIFFGFVGYSLTITIFTPMILHGVTPLLSVNSSLSTKTIVLGVLLALYPLGQFLGSPILGALSDHFGRRRMLLWSLGLCTCFYMLVALSLSIASLTLLMISLFLAGLCESNVVIAQSAIADVTDQHNRARLFGYIFVSASLAYVFGPLVGGQIAHFLGYAMPFWVAACLLLLTFIAVAIAFRETTDRDESSQISYFKAVTNILNIFTDKRLRFLYFLNFLFYLAIFGFFRCYPMYLVDEFHMGVGRESLYIAWVSLPIILVNFWLIGHLSKRYSAKTITTASAVLFGLLMILIIIPSAEYALWFTLFIATLALAVCLTACTTYLSLMAPQADQGKVMGNNTSLQVFAEAFSGFVGGLLAAVVIKLPLIVLGGVAVVAGLLLIFYKQKQ